MQALGVLQAELKGLALESLSLVNLHKPQEKIEQWPSQSHSPGHLSQGLLQPSKSLFIEAS